MKVCLSILLFSITILFFTGPITAQAQSASGQTRFERMDTNNDGKLSKTEFKGPPPAFNRLDKNGDGFISSGEAEGTRLDMAAGQGRDGRRRRSERGEPGQSPQPSSSATAKELIYVDTHNHLVGKRSKGKLNLEKQAQIAIKAMDAGGIKLNLIMPMPQTVSQKLRLTLEDLLPIIDKYPNRFAALGGGGTLNVMIQQAIKDGKVTRSMEKKFDRGVKELVDKGAAGFGEMTAEHFSMKSDHPHVTAPPDHPLFLRLADHAAKYRLPIDLHMEAVPQDLPLPPRLKSPPNPKIVKNNIEPLRRLLAHNRKANIIWVHMGWDNTEKRTVELTRELLEENPNLYISLRVASGMQQRRTAGTTFPLDTNNRLKPLWLSLFKEFPARFLIGSDEIIKPANDHPSAGSIQSTISLLEQLPPGLKKQIGSQNAYALYKIKK